MTAKELRDLLNDLISSGGKDFTVRLSVDGAMVDADRTDINEKEKTITIW